MTKPVTDKIDKAVAAVRGMPMGTVDQDMRHDEFTIGEQQELEPHADLRREFVERRIQAGIDSGAGIPADGFLRELGERSKEPRPEPAVWPKKP